MKLLIDGDEVCYKAAQSVQFTKYKVSIEGDCEVVYSTVSKRELVKYLDDKPYEYYYIEEPVLLAEALALSNAKDVIERLLSTFSTSDYTLYFSGKDNFRYGVATIEKYKGNRTAPKPTHYEATRQFMLDNFNCEVCDGMEADDGMAIAQWGAEEGSTTIISSDKDLRMVEGNHYSIYHAARSYTTEEMGWYYFFCQILTGDSTDNIPGLYRVAGKRASEKSKKALLGLTPAEAYEYVVALYYDSFNCSNKSYPFVEEVEKIVYELGTLLWMKRSKSLEEDWRRWL